MKKGAFSLCSNNYLAKALVAAESFLVHHPDYHFTLILVDRFSTQVNYPRSENLSIIEVSSFVANIDELASIYNIIELNTAVKARSFIYLLDSSRYTWLIYLDPDLLIVSRFSELEQLLATESYNLIITPHGCSPIDDGKTPSEIDLITYGVYNLGFLALYNTRESRRFLDWWHSRLMKYCYMEPARGMFTDQLWMNYAPLYFDAVHIFKNLGYNVANWNLYERNLTCVNGRYIINGHQELRFFHFSHYKYDDPYAISNYQNRHSVDEIPDLKLLIDDYQSRLVNKSHTELKSVPCHYASAHQKNGRRGPIRRIFRKLRHAYGSLLRTADDKRPRRLQK
jgi:hypothetical protein